MSETETQIRLRRAKDALESARNLESSACKALYDAVQSTARIKEQYEELFLRNEQEERTRKLATYRHTTK